MDADRQAARANRLREDEEELRASMRRVADRGSGESLIERGATHGGKVLRQIAANAEELGGGIRDIFRFTPPVMLARAMTDALRVHEREKRTREFGEGPTIGPREGFAEKSGDVGVQAQAMAFDPMNWAGAGIVAKGAGRLAKGAEKAAEALVPKSILRMGKSKEAREASAARRAAEAAEMEKPVRETPRSAEERAAVQPDKYRQMYEREGEEAVMRAAARGEHIRRSPTGPGYIGFPRDITTRADIRAMRARLDKQLDDAQEAIAFAEGQAGTPERAGSWYKRARGGISETTEPWMLNRETENIATHSAGVSPESETGFALRHGQSRAIGAPQRGFREKQQEELDAAIAEGRAANLRFKIGEYRKKNDPRADQGSPFGTNDFRAAQEHNYTLPSGAPWDRGVTDVMHPVMDAERALTVARARGRGQPGMTGEIAQEYPWVLGKGEDLFLEGKFAGASELESKLNALREANKTSADYYPKHTMSLTYERVPGEKTGHRPDVAGLPLEAQAEYGNVFTRQPTDTDAFARDILLAAARLRQAPPIASAGSWMGKQQPLTIARPLVPTKVATRVTPTGERNAKGQMKKKVEKLAEVMEPTDEIMQALKATEMFRGLNLAQQSVAGNLPVTMAGRTGKTNVLAERMGRNELGNPQSLPPTAEEMRALEAIANKYGYDVTATSRGALLMPMWEHALSEQQRLRGLRKGGGAGMREVEAAFPGSRAQPAGREGFYEDVTPPEAEMGKGIGTTRVIEQLAKAPPEVSRGLSESDEVRRAIKELIKADAEAQGKGAKVSEAIQKSRRWLAGEDFNRVVELVRGGMKVPAAMALLGYSLAGMAADDAPRAAAR